MKKLVSLARRASLAAIVMQTLLATGVAAAVTRSDPAMFEITHDLHVPVTAAKAYEAVVQPSHWWNSRHTFSGDAHNLSFDAKAGGCWCEALVGGGSVQHMRVIYADPGKLLRLSGALGPLQDQPLTGVMTWTFKDDPAGGASVKFIFRVAGPLRAEDNWPPLVDSVLGEQMDRLGRLLETGSPEKPRTL